MSMYMSREARAAAQVMAKAAQGAAKAGTADEAILMGPLLPDWSADGDYMDAVGLAYQYNRYPYRCGVAHRASDYPEETPETLPALWWAYHGSTRETALPWRQPDGAHDQYKVGEMVVWSDGLVYRCVSDTSFDPGAYAQAWEVVA